MKLEKKILTVIVILCCVVNVTVYAEVIEIVLSCKVTMNKTLQKEKYKQRQEEITLVISEYEHNDGNKLRVVSKDSSWPIFFTSTVKEAVDAIGWKIEQKLRPFDKKGESIFSLNRFSGELVVSQIEEEINFQVRGNCRKKEARF
jgi:hypothetical protein